MTTHGKNILLLVFMSVLVGLIWGTAVGVSL